MRLFEYDAYASITRFMDPAGRYLFVDVGANHGVTARRMLDEFPGATVYAFEPAPETFATLARNVADDERIKPVQLACGSTSGTVDFHVTKNHWCSSVLAPSALGKRYYGDWYDTAATVPVRIVRLDDWARAQGLTLIDFMKVDAQGYDLEVLKGAEGLLRSGAVKAINCECQFAPEYEGCATFSQVDQFLASCGFALHQMHEVWSKGDEEQTSYADALWVRVDVLRALRENKDLMDLSPKGRLSRALRALATRGHSRVALMGAGQHTQRLAPHLHNLPLPIAAIVDDNPERAGTAIDGVPVLPRSALATRDITAIVLSSDAHEARMWDTTADLRAAGVEVVGLYRVYHDTPATVAAA